MYTEYNDTSNVNEIQKERNDFLNRLSKIKSNMNSENTLILSVLGESPYAEMVGVINIPYCQNPELYNNQGCIWYPGAYLPLKQPSSL